MNSSENGIGNHDILGFTGRVKIALMIMFLQMITPLLATMPTLRYAGGMQKSNTPEAFLMAKRIPTRSLQRGLLATGKVTNGLLHRFFDRTPRSGFTAYHRFASSFLLAFTLIVRHSDYDRA